MFSRWNIIASGLSKPANCRLFFWRPETVTDTLKNVYKEKLLPLEERHLFHLFHSPKYSDIDFESKPMILLMGQYSTGKTTLIRYLLGTDFPGMRIGPEPTTDKFMAIMYDETTRLIPGNALVMDPSKPFAPLAKYGNVFLTKFQCSMLKNNVLENLTLVDTPGILSGEKQRVDRGYDFSGVLHWFGERVDRIILLFDAHKLDISDEFKWSIEALKGFDDKILILLNKADMVDHQSLMRIYGSLMWSLDKVLSTPEVPKVYVGSFWDQSLHNTINRKLFEDEENDLITELQSLPRNNLVRKINDLAKRARLAKAHAVIMNAVYKQMPTFFGKERRKSEIIDLLPQTFKDLQNDSSACGGDFPDVKCMQEKLKDLDFKHLKDISNNLIHNVDHMLAHDIPRIMTMLPDEATPCVEFKAGALSRRDHNNSPFSYKTYRGFDAGRDDNDWIVAKFRANYDKTFDKLNADGTETLKKHVVREEFLKTNLPSYVLSKIYLLADIDGDGFLDKDEFALANYIIHLVSEGYDLPDKLPPHLIPPSKRT